MDLTEFLDSVEGDSPPQNLPETLQALWYDWKDDWDKAHRIVQEIPTAEGSWVHAYLHRKEGDLGNARYWYSRAGHPEATGDLETEWRDIVSILIDQ